MTLTAGTKLGSYEIVGAIGAGDMGEVCRARDTRLARRNAESSVELDVFAEAEMTTASEMNVVTVQLVRNG
jgi:hypothetical protein